MSKAKRSKDEVILTCKEGTCPWDYRNAPIYEWHDKYGRKWWRRRVRCRDCGSVKYRKYEPRLPLQPVGAWSYDRPPGWYDTDVKFYWGKATEQRILRGQVELPEGVELKLRAV